MLTRISLQNQWQGNPGLDRSFWYQGLCSFLVSYQTQMRPLLQLVYLFPRFNSAAQPGKQLWPWDYAIPYGGKKKEYRHKPLNIGQEKKGVISTCRLLDQALTQSQTEGERSVTCSQ